MKSHLKTLADDSCLIAIHTDPHIAVQQAQIDLMTLQKYFYNNSTFFNSTKTEVMFLKPLRKDPVEIDKIKCHTRDCLQNDFYDVCNCSELEYKELVKYLGIMIDSKFKMKQHVLQLC